MMDIYNDLEELCMTLGDELKKANQKIGGELSAGDIEYIDKLTHAIKSVKTTMAMMDSEYSNGNSYRGNYGYSRARRSGKYSRNGYAYHDGMTAELRELMQDAPDEQTRQEFQRLINKLQNM